MPLPEQEGRGEPTLRKGQEGAPGRGPFPLRFEIDAGRCRAQTLAVRATPSPREAARRTESVLLP